MASGTWTSGYSPHRESDSSVRKGGYPARVGYGGCVPGRKCERLLFVVEGSVRSSALPPGKKETLATKDLSSDGRWSWPLGRVRISPPVLRKAPKLATPRCVVMHLGPAASVHRYEREMARPSAKTSAKREWCSADEVNCMDLYAVSPSVVLPPLCQPKYPSTHHPPPQARRRACMLAQAFHQKGQPTVCHSVPCHRGLNCAVKALSASRSFCL